jgi:hypothetical protein
MVETPPMRSFWRAEGKKRCTWKRAFREAFEKFNNAIQSLHF